MHPGTLSSVIKSIILCAGVKKMKKLIALPVLLFILGSLPLIAQDDEFKLANVPAEYCGTYVPVAFEQVLEETASFSKAMRHQKSKRYSYHDILILGQEMCYSDMGFHDGYAIKASEFADYRFVKNSAGCFIIDANGNSYHRISLAKTPEEGAYSDFAAFAVGKIFSDARELDNVTVKGPEVIIDGTEYLFMLDENFFDGADAWFFSEKGAAGLVIDGISARLVKGGRGEYHGVTYATGDVVAEFPLFYYKGFGFPSELDVWYMDVNKPQLRILRNLVYARHGYVFKDKKLASLFSRFSWYKKNPSFSESAFDRAEKEFVDNCRRLETRD